MTKHDVITTLRRARNTLGNSANTPSRREALRKLDTRIRKEELKAAAAKAPPPAASSNPQGIQEATAIEQAVSATIAREINVIRNEQRVTAAKVEVALAELAAAVARVESGRSAG